MIERKMGVEVQTVEVSAAVRAAWMEASDFNVWTTRHRKCHVLNWIT